MYSTKLLSKQVTLVTLKRHISVSNIRKANHTCKLLVVGGGSGGCSVAAKFANEFRNKNDIIIVEPTDTHYYQPMFTLIGGGTKTLKDAGRPMGKVLPKDAQWLKDSVTKFEPKTNTVYTKNGDCIKYDFLVVGMGLQLNYDQIPGLLEGLRTQSSGVCSNYSPDYVNRTFQALEEFESGNLIFTFPNTPVKCPGAPQKICYIAEHYLRKKGKKSKATIYYNTSLPVIFGVKTYADALWKVVAERDINVNLRTNLVEVKPKEKTAVFVNLDKPEEKITMQYSLLHVTPPMSAPNVLRACKEFTNAAGFLEVNKDTLQSVKFSNVFGIGDCTDSPNSKTAAAVAAQSNVVFNNLKSVMSGATPTRSYNGYASCPLVTGYNSCILAEFDYSLTPLETFPIRQDKERWSMYVMKKDFMPPLYWHVMLNGHWNGPGLMRKLMHLGLSK